MVIITPFPTFQFAKTTTGLWSPTLHCNCTNNVKGKRITESFYLQNLLFFPL